MKAGRKNHKPKHDTIGQYMAAAEALVEQLGMTPMAHSVFVRNYHDPITNEFARELCIAVRPEYLDKIIVPAICEGLPVVQVPWPDDE